MDGNAQKETCRAPAPGPDGFVPARRVWFWHWLFWCWRHGGLLSGAVPFADGR